MKLIQKLVKKKETLKESFFKSVIYRIITIFLGMLVIFVVTGDLLAAFSLGFVPEAVQFVNYFIYETIWTNYHDKRLRIKIELTRKVDVKLDFDLLKEISFEFSQRDKDYFELKHKDRSFMK